jgi:hypothetical protein
MELVSSLQEIRSDQFGLKTRRSLLIQFADVADLGLNRHRHSGIRNKPRGAVMPAGNQCDLKIARIESFVGTSTLMVGRQRQKTF